MQKKCKKHRVVFPFVEAGLGHIMPMQAIADAFERKYGEETEVIRTYFFQDTKNANLNFIEQELIKEVKLHNKRKGRGNFQFFLMWLFGSKVSLKYLMEKRYKKSFAPAMEYMYSLQPDLIFHTHFSTLYYSCEARKLGALNTKIFAYCPDPIIGRQWDRRVDLMGVSSYNGIKIAEKKRQFQSDQLFYVPFLIRDKVKEFTESKQYYKRILEIPENQFTVLLADGAYGAGKLKKTVYQLLKSKVKMTVIAACGKNQALHEEFSKITPPENIYFRSYGFTDKMLMLSAACDLFVGKSGASNLAEPAYFGAPSIINFCATPIEKWICRHHVAMGVSVKIRSIKKAIKLIEKWASEPKLMKEYIDACARHKRCDGPEYYAEKIWQSLQEDEKKLVNADYAHLEQADNAASIGAVS